MKEKIPYKIYLSEEEMPTQWYNVRADMKTKPAPLLNPGTGKPLTAAEMEPIFCKELVKQELDNDTKLMTSSSEVLGAASMRRWRKVSRPMPYLA